MPRRISVEIVGDSRSVERAFRRAGRAGSSFSASITDTTRRVGRNVAVLGAAVGAAGVVTGKAFSAFEESLDRIVGLAGGTREVVEGMSKELLRLGPEVGKSPRELADALYFVASAGVAASEQMEVVESSSKAAAAGLGQTEVVADAVTSAMNAYGSEVVNAARATDVLVNTVRFGKGEAESFAPVLGTVAAIAAQLGVSFEEVGAALAAQTRLGISAETAAIQLQATFSSLLKTAPKAEKALRGVGLSSEELRKQLREKGLLSVLETLKVSFGDNTAAMAEAFPNIRALRGLLTLVGKSADSTREVFDGMKDSTGALGTAFDAVSQGEAFRFQQTLASLQATAIQLGGLLAPVAGALARGATAAVGVFNDLVADITEARTVSAKINVVWRGARDAVEGATSVLADAVAAVDWEKVWQSASGIAEGLQERLEEIDWGVIGEEIGDAFADAVAFAVPKAKELAERISDAIAAIDFEELGKKMGPGLAAALVTAFTTLLDPAFWIRNWDLALAVALTVFRGRVLILAGRLAAVFGRALSSIAAPVARVFGRLADRAGTALVTGLLRVSERAATVVFEALARIPALVGRIFRSLVGIVRGALAPLERLVRNVFNRLGKIGQFVVRVLGIQAGINAVVGFAKSVGETFRRLGASIAGALDTAWETIKRSALRAAIAIVEPFTHIPGFLGGGTFQKLQKNWQATLDAMESSSSATAKSINRSLASIKDETVTVRVNVLTGNRPEEGRVGAEETEATDRATAAAGARGNAAAAAFTRIEKETAAQNRAATAAATRLAASQAASATAAAKAAKEAKKAKARATAAFESLLEATSFEFDVAESAGANRRALAVLDREEAAIRARIKAVGASTELKRQLFDVEQRRDAINKKIAENRKTSRQQAQFRALGLDAEGAALPPTVANLQKQLASLGKRIEGTPLEKKFGGKLARVRAVLASEFGKATAETRDLVAQLFETIRSEFDKQGQKGPLTKTTAFNISALTKGIDLPAGAAQELQARAARFNSAGISLARSGVGAFGVPVADTGGTTIIHTTVELDGNAVGTAVTRHQTKSRARNARGARGRPGGI